MGTARGAPFLRSLVLGWHRWRSCFFHRLQTQPGARPKPQLHGERGWLAPHLLLRAHQQLSPARKVVLTGVGGPCSTVECRLWKYIYVTIQEIQIKPKNQCISQSVCFLIMVIFFFIFASYKSTYIYICIPTQRNVKRLDMQPIWDTKKHLMWWQKTQDLSYLKASLLFGSIFPSIFQLFPSISYTVNLVPLLSLFL